MSDSTPVETYRGVVYPWQADHMGHMNVQFYVAKFDSATWHFFAMLGLPPGRLRAEGRGMAAVEQTITYRAELLPGDLVVITSTLLAVTTKTLRFRHDMRNAETGVEAAFTELVGVHLDLATRRGVTLPPDVRERAETILAERE